MSKESEITINHLEGEKISHFGALSGIEYQRLNTGPDGGRS